jgi:hypothetical protein
MTIAGRRSGVFVGVRVDVRVRVAVRVEVPVGGTRVGVKVRVGVRVGGTEVGVAVAQAHCGLQNPTDPPPNPHVVPGGSHCSPKSMTLLPHTPSGSGVGVKVGVEDRVGVKVAGWADAAPQWTRTSKLAISAIRLMTDSSSDRWTNSRAAPTGPATVEDCSPAAAHLLCVRFSAWRDYGGPGSAIGKTRSVELGWNR